MDSKPEKIIIGIAELVVVHNPAILVTIGLGSCVAISIRDPIARFGGLSHILLPSISESNNKSNPMKFADSALEMVVDHAAQERLCEKQVRSKDSWGSQHVQYRW